MFLSVLLGAFASWLSRDWMVYRLEAAEGAAGTRPRRFRYDPADKLLLGHPLVMAAFVARALPDLYREVGRATPFGPGDIQVGPLEWLAGAAAEDPDLSTRTSDLVAFLQDEEGRLCAVVPVEVQARYQAEMTARLHQYAGYALELLYRHGHAGPDVPPPPVAPLLIAMGDTPWPADRGPWNLGPGRYTPGFFPRGLAFARQDLADWRDAPRDRPPLDDWAAVFFALALLRSDCRRELNRRSSLQDPAAVAAVEGLIRRARDLVPRILAKARAEDPTAASEQSWRHCLVRWLNGALLPLWSGILRKEIKALGSVEDLAMFDNVMQEVQEAFEARLEATGQDFAQEGRREGRQEGRHARDVENLVETVQRHGALPAAELDAYRARLADMPGEKLPNAVRAGEGLVAFPAGPARQRAVRTFVATDRVPTPQDTN